MNKIAITILLLFVLCICALVLSVNFAVKCAKRKAFEHGIIFKNLSSFLDTAKAQIVVLKNSDGITKGAPVVTDVCSADHFTKSGYSVGGFSDDELLEVAALLESNSEDAIARAIVKYADELLIDNEEEITDFMAYPGNNLEAELDGLILRAGSQNFVKEKVTIPPEIQLRAEELSGQGKNIIFFSKGKRLLGMIAASDAVNADAIEAINELKNLDVRVVMLSDRDQLSAEAIAQAAGTDVVIPGILPEKEAEVINKLSDLGKVIIYSDLISNRADVEFRDKTFLNIPGAIRLSGAVLRNIKENLLFVSICLVIGIILITSAIFNPSGFSFILMIFGALMGLLSFLAIVNAFRLRFFDIRRSVNDKYQRNAIQIAKINIVSEEARRE